MLSHIGACYGRNARKANTGVTPVLPFEEINFESVTVTASSVQSGFQITDYVS